MLVRVVIWRFQGAGVWRQPARCQGPGDGLVVDLAGPGEEGPVQLWRVGTLALKPSGAAMTSMRVSAHVTLPKPSHNPARKP